MTAAIATTSSQSSRLLACGTSADTADMSIRTITEPMIKDIAQWETPILLTMPYASAKDIYRGDYVEPAWSLGALLGLLPKEIYDGNSDSYYFSLAKEFPLSEEYGAAYIPCWDNGNAIVRRRDDSPIEACVQLIEWLTANGYKLNDPVRPCREKGDGK